MKKRILGLMTALATVASMALPVSAETPETPTPVVYDSADEELL